MLEGQSVLDVIARRRSIRSFSALPIEPGKLARLDAVLAGAAAAVPFADTDPVAMRFLRVQAAARNAGDGMAGGPDGEGAPRAIEVGTYGTISGAGHYLVGIMPVADQRMERFSYAFETIVLSAAALGLGTCWLGGFFDRDGVSSGVSLADGEFIPIISPLGYPADQASQADRMLRRSAGSDRRKPWGELFFDRTTDVPLAPGQAGPWRQPLEMVRLGPSASNKQPWRIVRQGDRFDFHLQRTRGYGLPIYDIQRNDIGIAQCHFEWSARELGLAGHWSDEPGLAGPVSEESGLAGHWSEASGHEGNRARLPADFEYIVSWIIDS